MSERTLPEIYVPINLEVDQLHFEAMRGALCAVTASHNGPKEGKIFQCGDNHCGECLFSTDYNIDELPQSQVEIIKDKFIEIFEEHL